MATRNGQHEMYYTIALPKLYVEQLVFLAQAAGLKREQVRYIELPIGPGPDAAVVPDELDTRSYAVHYDSLATWERLHSAVMDSLFDRALQEVPVPVSRTA